MKGKHNEFTSTHQRLFIKIHDKLILTIYRQVEEATTNYQNKEKIILFCFVMGQYDGFLFTFRFLLQARFRVCLLQAYF